MKHNIDELIDLPSLDYFRKKVFLLKYSERTKIMHITQYNFFHRKMLNLEDIAACFDRCQMHFYLRFTLCDKQSYHDKVFMEALNITLEKR